MNKVKTTILLNGVEETINSNLDRATKEVWVVSDKCSNVFESRNFIVRHLLTSNIPYDSASYKGKASKILFWAKRDCRTILVSNKLAILKRGLPKVILEWLKVLI